MMTVVHVILSLVEGPQKTGVGQAAASRESSPPYRHVGPARNSQGVSPGLMPNKIQQKHFQLEVEAFEGKWDCQRAETSNSSRKTCWSRNYFPSPRIQPQCPPHFSATFRHPPQAAKEPAGFWLTWAICVTTHNSRNSLESKRLLGLDCVLSIIWRVYHHDLDYTTYYFSLDCVLSSEGVYHHDLENTTHFSLPWMWSIICNLASASLVIYFRRTTLNYNCCVGYL